MSVLGKRPAREEDPDDGVWIRKMAVPVSSTILIGKQKVPVTISWPHARRNSKYFAAFDEKEELPDHILPEWEGVPEEDANFRIAWQFVNGFPANPANSTSTYFLDYFMIDYKILVVESMEGDLDGPYFYVFENPKTEVLQLLRFWHEQNKLGFSSTDRSLGNKATTEEERQYDAMLVLLDDHKKCDDISGQQFCMIVKILIWSW